MYTYVSVQTEIKSNLSLDADIYIGVDFKIQLPGKSNHQVCVGASKILKAILIYIDT